MKIKAKEIAALLKGEVEGDPQVEIDRPSKIEEGGPGSITFFGNPKYEPYVYTTTASVLLVPKTFRPKQPVSPTLIKVDDVYASIAVLLEQFGQQIATTPEGIADSAIVHPSCKIGKGVTIGPMAIVEEGVELGDHVVIHGQTFIGKNTRIGAHSVLHPGARIMHGCILGQHCVLHPNAVIGSDGFGFAPQPDGTFKKIPQIGNVILEDGVEIGACTTVDRASMGSTILRRGVKLDNLIQVGHNVEIGENTVIAAQSGIAGSTKIGKNCLIGGQVGFVGHLKIADGTKAQAQTGFGKNVRQPDQAFCGTPAIDWTTFIKASGVFKQLPELYRQLHRMEKELAALQKRTDEGTE